MQGESWASPTTYWVVTMLAHPISADMGLAMPWGRQTRGRVWRRRGRTAIATRATRTRATLLPGYGYPALPIFLPINWRAFDDIDCHQLDRRTRVNKSNATERHWSPR